MLIWSRLVRLNDWFIPAAARLERSEYGLAQNFVFTHLFGPLLSQSISVFLYLSDPHPGFACWTVIVGIWLFWALPFVYKYTGNLQLSALMSVELLAFASLFGPIGILFAAPMTVVTYVLVKRLYVIEALDTPTPIPGEGKD